MADGNFQFKVNGFDSYTLLLGEELRGERATFGKSLLQVQKDLKIKAAYISAIENCDLDAFPNKGFVAGYVRSYARYLNLNSEEVYERFCMESGFSSYDSPRKLDGINVHRDMGLKKINAQKQFDWKPSYVGFQEVDNSILSKGYLFLAPFFLAFLIIFGIGFGAWKVLIDIQKLKIVPADSLPIIMSEMNLKSSEIINENKVKSYQLKSKDFESLNYEASENRKPLAPQVSYRDGPIVNLQLEDIGVLGINSTKLDVSLPFIASSQGSVGNLVIKNFDFGIIPEFDVPASAANNHIVYADKDVHVSDAQKTLNFKFEKDLRNADQPLLSQEEKNEVASKVETTLNIFAIKPSWIRINDEAKRVVFEKILKAGEVLNIRSNWINGNLRAGNAKDLFFSLNGVTYGPVSDSRKVIKNFRIDPQNIFKSLKINDLKDSHLNGLLSKKRSL